MKKMLSVDKTDEIIRLVVEDFCLDVLFEFNDDLTRKAMTDKVCDFLKSFRNCKLGNYDDYQVVCNEINNSPAEIDQNNFLVDVLVTNTWETPRHMVTKVDQKRIYSYVVDPYGVI